MERFEETKKASLFGVIGNIFLFVIKLIISIITHSQAMIADTCNSGSDIFNSFMTYIGNRIASKDADDDHNLGHGKAEYLYSMFISITMVFLGLKIVYDSVLGIFIKDNYVFNFWLIIVCIITIIVKFFLFLYTNKVAKKYDNLLVKANSDDHRNDCFLTSLNLFSAVLSYFGIKYIDSIVGILISLWIILSGVEIFIKSYDVLMDKTISVNIKNKVLDIIFDHKEVLKVNHFNATPVGYRYQISFTIFVDGKLSTFESHGIADHLEKEIKEKIPEIYLTVIHVNPVNLKVEK